MWRLKRALTRATNSVIEARIREINDALQLLKSLTARSFEELSIHEKLSMRYLIIQLVEASASICTRILLGAWKETVEAIPECFIRLGSKDVIPGDLASRLASAARLRNLLVHRYWLIDDRRVYEAVKRNLSDFEDYIKYVRRFMERSSIEEN